MLKSHSLSTLLEQIALRDLSVFYYDWRNAKFFSFTYSNKTYLTLGHYKVQRVRIIQEWELPMKQAAYSFLQVVQEQNSYLFH